MQGFEELFERYFTSNQDFEENQPKTLFDEHFLDVSKNEEKGTVFFERFLPKAYLGFEETPPFEVTSAKTYIFKENPGILKID